MKFKLKDTNALYAFYNKNWTEVDLKACFPVEQMDRFISVLDKNGKEIFLIEDLNSLAIENRKVIDAYLDFKSFKYDVVGVYCVEEDFGLRVYKVKTQSGDLSFQTELENWPQKLDDGSLHIQDLYGDLFRVRTLEFGREYILPFIDE